MADIRFMTIPVRFANASVSGNGTVTASGSADFGVGTTVIGAGVAIQAWELSFGNRHNSVKSAAASISNVRFGATSVTFEASLRFEDNSGNKLDPKEVSLTALVTAIVEVKTPL